jgi:NADPH:quinone reductase-like Zn-dependent oxidoreductase
VLCLINHADTAAVITARPTKYTQLKKSDWVVQNAANSGVGRSLMAIARARGLRTINFVRRNELINELKAAGGDVVLVDQPGAVEEALRFVDDGAVRLGVDGIGGQSTSTLAQTLSVGGVLVCAWQCRCPFRPDTLCDMQVRPPVTSGTDCSIGKMALPPGIEPGYAD